MKKTITIILITAIILTISISTFANETTTVLTDINISKVSNWAKEYVTGAEKLGICNFRDYTLAATRLEFCEMIYETIKISPVEFSLLEGQENKFKDCNSIAVDYLHELGVINGTSEDTFSPNDKINREEVATITYKLAKILNLQGFYDDYRLSSYIYFDQDKMSEWAVEAIYQLKTIDLMDGVDNDMFAPKALFTREQATVLAVKLFSKILDDNKETTTSLNQADLRIRVQEDKYTDEVKEAIKSKYPDNAIVDKMLREQYLEHTNLIIASGEPCIIIGKYDTDFLKRLDEWGIEYDEFINDLTCIYNNIDIDIDSKDDSIEDTATKNLQSFFEKESVSLTCEMAALANSEEYLSLITVNEDLKSEIKTIADGDYVNPKEIHFITLDDESSLKIIKNYSPLETISNSIYEKIKSKFNGTIMGNMINSRYGSNVVAVTSMLTYGKGYIMPKGFKDSITIVLKYDGDYSSIVSFNEIGQGVIGSNAIFVKNMETDIVELIQEIMGDI